MATIRDVAKMAGVSIGTVSNVLNGIASVAPANRKLVLDAIANLGYRRNNAASQLRSKTSGAIGLIVPDITNPFYPEIARGVADYASTCDYYVFLCNKDRSAAAEEVAIEALLSRKVDGILLLKPHARKELIYEAQQCCAMVLFDVDPCATTCDVVNVDDYAGFCQAIHKAYSMGHRRFGYIAGLSDSRSSTLRAKAYHDTLAACKLEDDPTTVKMGDFSQKSGMEHFASLLNLKNPPTCILTANDMMAKGALSQAQVMGVNIPGDISIIGFDDIFDVQWTYPPLTTTWHPKYELGELCAELLIKRIGQRQKNEMPEREVITMKTQFCDRGSLAPIRDN